MLRNWKFIIGFALILVLVLFSVIGPLFVDPEATRPASSPFNQSPSTEYPLGTDNIGRDILALMIVGMPSTLIIGLIAGSIGTGVGTMLGMTSGYFRGPLETVTRLVADIALTIPTLLVLVTIAAYTRTTTIEGTALIVSIFAWAQPARTIRAQTLSMRERRFALLAKLSGMGDLEILFKELFPNLLPYIMASFVGSMSAGILASVGIQLLGLGPLLDPNIGMILQYAFYAGAMFQGRWWWWSPPVIALLMFFVGAFLISVSMDEFSNPRLREVSR